MSEDKQTIAQVLWIAEMEVKAYLDALLVATLSTDPAVRLWGETNLRHYAEMKQQQYAAKGFAPPSSDVSTEGASWAMDEVTQ